MKKLDKIKGTSHNGTEHRAQSTEHRAQSTEHRAHNYIASVLFGNPLKASLSTRNKVDSDAFVMSSKKVVA